jgi:hypothetical protein
MDTRGYITTAETRQALRVLYREDGETNLQKAFLSALTDDLKPVSEAGRWRPSPLLVLAAIAVLAFLAVFLYFSLGGRG